MIQKIISSVVVDTLLNEPTNQNSTNVLNDYTENYLFCRGWNVWTLCSINQQIKIQQKNSKAFRSTKILLENLGTSVINSLMFPPSLPENDAGCGKSFEFQTQDKNNFKILQCNLFKQNK